MLRKEVVPEYPEIERYAPVMGRICFRQQGLMNNSYG